MRENDDVDRLLRTIVAKSFAGLVDLTGSTWMPVVRQDDVWVKVGDDLRLAMNLSAEREGKNMTTPPSVPQKPTGPPPQVPPNREIREGSKPTEAAPRQTKVREDIQQS